MNNGLRFVIFLALVLGGVGGCPVAETFTLYAPDGGLLALSSDYHVLGVDDGGLPPLDVASYALPLQDGAVLRDITAGARVVSITAVVTGTSYDDYVDSMAALIDILRPYRLKAPGATRYWRLARTVGSNTAELRCVPAGLIKEQQQGFTRPIGVRLLALDPYWYAVSEETETLDPADAMTINRIVARVDGVWEDFDAGANNSVRTLALDGTTLYAGGGFTDVGGGTTVYRIAAWNGSAWSTLGSGMDGTVYALAVGPDGTLYAGGDFTTADGNPANRIAAWNGSAWSALGTGMNSIVYALEFGPDGTLYAGGAFTTADGNPANRIAAWNGSAWSALGTGMDNIVYALVYDETNDVLYAGGGFTTADGGTANRTAVWDGSAWSAMGSGMNGTVSTIALGFDGLLYAGGSFTTADGNAALRIAAWNGYTWAEVGNGVNNPVYALATASDGTLYVGGNFTQAGDLTLTDRIARWNGYTWAALPLDLPGSSDVAALLVDDEDLYIGGVFSGAGAVSGAVTVQNEGSINTPVVIYITGPGTLVSIRNETTSREMLFNMTINAGEDVKIDLTPGAISIESIWRGRLEALPNSDYDLDLAASPVAASGNNIMSVFMLNTTVDTDVELAWTPRWYSWEEAVQ